MSLYALDMHEALVAQRTKIWIHLSPLLCLVKEYGWIGQCSRWLFVLCIRTLKFILDSMFVSKSSKSVDVAHYFNEQRFETIHPSHIAVLGNGCSV